MTGTAMDQTPPPRLPAQLESAVQRVRMAARAAAEQTVDSLGLAALATHGVMQRDALLGAQYELNRKLAIYALTFNETLDTDVARQTGTLHPTPHPAITPESLVASWESLSLVDDDEVEMHISADRFALEIAHACEWEIRELDAYIGSLLGKNLGGHDHNPLRAEVVAQAMMRAIAQVSDRPEVRKVLATESGRSLAQAMRQTYADIVADLRHAGVKPMGLVVRHSQSHSTRPGALQVEAASGAHHAGPGTRPGAIGRDMAPQGRSAGMATGTYGGQGSRMGRVEQGLMSLIRRLNSHAAIGSASRWPSAESGGLTDAGAESLSDFDQNLDAEPLPARFPHPHAPGQPQGRWAGSDALRGGWGAQGQRLAAPNLIHAHRDELRRAATGTLDHRVIDVVAGLFDQILSDAKVPPQMARQIARLQLPVLRAALGDASFFSTRRHPVRRFINRIASAGSAVDNFDDSPGRALLQCVTRLVQEVVDGDFERVDVYEQQVQALEAFLAAQAQDEVQALGDAQAVLAGKEQALRVQQQFGQVLGQALQGLPVPDYLQRFIADTWSQAIAQAEQQGGADSAQARRLREAGSALMLSVQPKGSPGLRQAFLRGLPQLMKELSQGMDLVHIPESARQAFFAQLLPAHAKALNVQPLSTLEHNLLARQVDQALATPLPGPNELPPPLAANGLGANPQQPIQAMTAPTQFSATEARAVGLVDDAAVDWSGPLDIDLGQEPELGVLDIQIDGLPPVEASEAPEPSRGKSLADHVQIGQAYQMHLEGQWCKVRLAHVSAARGFFLFTHGHKQRSALSMTHRMLVKLCEAGRLRGFENAYLLDRATARARRQLATLLPARR